MKTIGLVTTGGDAPGMNAAIRSVVRTAAHYKMDVIGYKRGWWGLIEEDSMPMHRTTVSNIISRGGTKLHTVRCPLFKQKKYRTKAIATLKKHTPGGLVVIGGDGSMRAAHLLASSSDVPIIGIPASIDNDIAGTDETIGFDTAINTALTAIDKIRDTASSHNRIFIVEVMGRRRGFLAANVGLASGAEIILTPETGWTKQVIVKKIRRILQMDKKSLIIVMAEGAGSSKELAGYLESRFDIPVRASNLGYIQRGGSPTVDSRILGSLFGNAAIKALKQKKGGLMMAWQSDSLAQIELSYPYSHSKKMDKTLLDTASILSGA
jgi:6-phosphofructokinase 1